MLGLDQLYLLRVTAESAFKQGRISAQQYTRLQKLIQEEEEKNKRMSDDYAEEARGALLRPIR